MTKKFKKGFTLVELVIVIAVIAILAAVLIPTFAGILERAKGNAKMQTVSSALKSFTLDKMADDNKSLVESTGYVAEMDGEFYAYNVSGELVKLSAEKLSDANNADYYYNTNFVAEQQGDVTIYEPIPAVAGSAVVGEESHTWEDLLNTQDTVNTNKKMIEVTNGVLTYVSPAISSLEISSNVTEIGESAFAADKNYNWYYGVRNENNTLTSVTIPSSVTAINQKAFLGCTALTNIVFPVGLQSIGDNAFLGCTALYSVTFNSGLQNVGNDAFKNCGSMRRLYIDSIETALGITYGANNAHPLMYATAVYGGPQTNDAYLYINGQIPTSLVIPDGVTEIKKNAFYCAKNITSLTIPSSLRYFAENTISSRNITSVYVDSLESWCGVVFANNVNYNPIRQSGSLNNKNTKLYVNNTQVTNLVIPDTVTEIKPYVFAGFKTLTSVTIPSSVTTIGESAFDGCTGISSVYIDDIAAWCNIDFGGSDSFNTANPLQNNMTGKTMNLYVKNGETYVKPTTITIPDTVTEIKNYVFCGNRSNVTKIILPNTIQKIGNYSFGSSSIATIDFSATTTSALTNIGKYAFSSSLTTIENADYLASFGWNASTSATEPNGSTVSFEVDNIKYNSKYFIRES